MSAQNQFAISIASPTTNTWVPLICPIKSNFVEIVNQTTVDINLRTNSADATTQITIPVNDSYVIHTPSYDYSFRGITRFIPGNVIGYVQYSGSGSGNAVGVYIL